MDCEQIYPPPMPPREKRASMLKTSWPQDDIDTLMCLIPIYGNMYQEYYPHFYGRYTPFDIKLKCKEMNY